MKEDINNPYFNLKHYEFNDLEDLINSYKSFDGLHKAKLNWLDRLISKEHKYGYNRMCVFGLWLMCGAFLPFWILFMFLIGNYTNNSNAIGGISFVICFIIGIVFELIYQHSCDKIDYNSLMDKVAQINIFEWLERN